MRLRHGWVVGWLACLGCHSVVAVHLDAEPDPADWLWHQGQEAMRQGQPNQAIPYYEHSLALAPQGSRNHLSLAAAHLENGDEASAAAHLAQYLAYHPEQVAVRIQYAELLWRLQRFAEAGVEYEKYVADAAEAGASNRRRWIHCHGRLLEVAEKTGDRYAEYLHRGIGLYLLACCRTELDDPQGALPAEGLLCKAATELTQAHDLAPDEARPCWYLYAVWQRLAQPQTAGRWLREAQAAALFSTLTPAEQRGLVLAGQTDQGRR